MSPFLPPPSPVAFGSIGRRSVALYTPDRFNVVPIAGLYIACDDQRVAFPVAERTADEILSLPLFPGITEQQQARVAEELARCR